MGRSFFRLRGDGFSSDHLIKESFARNEIFFGRGRGWLRFRFRLRFRFGGDGRGRRIIFFGCFIEQIFLFGHRWRSGHGRQSGWHRRESINWWASFCSRLFHDFFDRNIGWLYRRRFAGQRLWRGLRNWWFLNWSLLKETVVDGRRIDTFVDCRRNFIFRGEQNGLGVFLNG